MSKDVITYFIAGVNGVGKTTILSAITEQNGPFTLFKGSLELMEWLGIPKGNYEALRALPEPFKEKQVALMMENLFKQRDLRGRIVLIDAHIINYKRGKMIDSTGAWMQKMNGLIVVKAKPELILHRLKQDELTGKKTRDILPVGLKEEEELSLIQTYIQATDLAAQRIQEIYSLPTFTIENNSDSVEHAVSQFYKFHNTLIDSEMHILNNS